MAGVLLGITLSLCANIAATPVLNMLAVAVAACPPLALLLSVELLYRALKRHRTESADASRTETERQHETPAVSMPTLPKTGATAEQKMWAHYQAEWGKSRTPTGAELDRVAGTNNYGRRVLRRWHTLGRTSGIPRQSA